VAKKLGRQLSVGRERRKLLRGSSVAWSARDWTARTGFVAHVIEPAASGRAKCRACDRAIAKGQLRFGERVPNPYGDGEATYWFHLRCAAFKRPEPVLEALADAAELDDREALTETARRGIDHPRLVRLAGAQRAASGRARCRHCRETIDKGAWRFALNWWEEGRFGPMGFIHAACAPAYFEDTEDLLARARHFSPELTDPDGDELAAQLAATAT
jgi:hypothetical protein